jgi:hypothetical protein
VRWSSWNVLGALVVGWAVSGALVVDAWTVTTGTFTVAAVEHQPLVESLIAAFAAFR